MSKGKSKAMLLYKVKKWVRKTTHVQSNIASPEHAVDSHAKG